MSLELIFMILGFVLASYSIVGNDAIQTLGTFLASNSKRPWWVLWAYACSILTVVLVYGWYVNGGDLSYGRLEKYPLPDPFTWLYVVPPFVLLFLTRFGLPVSTTFLVLTVFQAKNLQSMLIKSIAGYFVALIVAIVLYLLVAKLVEKRFLDTADRAPSSGWVALQWVSTGYLWAMWLIQDLANIYVYLPRTMDVGWMLFSLFTMLALHAVIFYTAGGAIQKIVTSKTNTADIRSATLVDFLFGTILLIFKEWSNMPMSTTWVFLGLLAGREIALSIQLQSQKMSFVLKDVGGDIGKAFIGLAVSVVLALGLPVVAEMIDPGAAGADAAPSPEPATAALFSGTLRIDGSQDAVFPPTAAIFVSAKVPGGRPMPVLAKKIPYGGEPVVEWALLPTDAPMGGTVPDVVEIKARLDLDGDPMGGTAPFEVVVPDVAQGTTGLELVLKPTGPE